MLNAIVMAAGKGTRMHSTKAKTMHKVLDKPMLEHIYDTLKKLQCNNTVFVVGHGKEEIEDYFKDKVDFHFYTSKSMPKLNMLYNNLNWVQLMQSVLLKV